MILSSIIDFEILKRKKTIEKSSVSRIFCHDMPIWAKNARALLQRASVHLSFRSSIRKFEKHRQRSNIHVQLGTNALSWTLQIPYTKSKTLQKPYKNISKTIQRYFQDEGTVQTFDYFLLQKRRP